MHRSLLLGAVSALALSSSAFAADIYRGDAVSYKDAPIHVAPHIWTGFYIGANVGYGWAEDQDIIYEYENNKKAKAPYDIGVDGVFAGGQIGYNAQRGRFVFGVEVDMQYSNVNDSGKGTGSLQLPGTVCCATDTTSLDADVEWFGTARARLGYAVDRTLFYITGGFAFGEVSIDNTYFFPGPSSGPQWPLAGSSSKSDVETGYVVGGGIEHALSGNWSWKVEYQYINLGEIDVSTPRIFANGAAAAVPQMTEVDADFHTVRVGLNYKLQRDHAPLK